MIKPAPHKTTPATSTVFLMVLLVIVLAACGQPTPTPFPTRTVVPTPTAAATSSPTATSTPIPLETYLSEAGFFSISLPATWQVAEQGMTQIGRYYRIGPPPLGPGPATSSLFVADGNSLTARQVAEQFLCGESCADSVELEEVTLGGKNAQRTVISENGRSLEWFFVPHLEQLLIFSLHDPDTLLTRQDLLGTLSLLEPTPVPTATATPTATPTPSYDIASVREWQVVTPDEAGIRFAVPVQWEDSGEWQWRPREAPQLLLGFRWETGRDLRPAALLPAGPEAGEVLAQEEYRSSWELVLTDTEGISTTLAVPTGLEQHVIVRIGLRVYDFYTRGPAPEAVANLRPVLNELLNTAEVTDVLFYMDDPSEVAVAWFDALLQDPTGQSALPYMTLALQEESPENGTPLALLGLSDRLLTYNLELVNSGSDRAVFEAVMALQNNSSIRRFLTLTRDELLGWRLASIESGE